MSWANNGPAGPPQGQPYGPPQTPPPQGPQQPRWAWWVIGIVIPVVGILITVMVSRPGSSDDTSDKTVESAPTRTSGSARSDGQEEQEQPTASPTKSAPADQVRYGPVDVTGDITDAGFYLELDTSKPVVVSSKGSDVIFSASLGDPGLTVPGSASNLAPWPDPETVPTAAECLQSVERNGSYSSYVKSGDRLCLRTGDSRIAYLQVVSAPNRGMGKLKVTVWETPAV